MRDDENEREHGEQREVRAPAHREVGALGEGRVRAPAQLERAEEDHRLVVRPSERAGKGREANEGSKAFDGTSLNLRVMRPLEVSSRESFTLL